MTPPSLHKSGTVHERDEVTGEWSRIHSEIFDLYSTPRNILVMKSSRMRSAGRVV